MNNNLGIGCCVSDQLAIVNLIDHLMDRPSRHCTYRSSRRPWGHDGTGIGAGLVLAGLVSLAVFAAEIAAVVLMVR